MPGDSAGDTADLVYRLAWIKPSGNVYVTGDDPEAANDGLARRTAPRIGIYAMRRPEMFAVLVLLLRPMHSDE